MIKGFGIDIIEIKRVEKTISRWPNFTKRIFTANERRYCLRKPRPHIHFALRFAAKEAVAKALGTGLNGLSWQEIEILRNKKERPKVILKGKAQEMAREKEIKEVLVSLSFTRENAVASAIALG